MSKEHSGFLTILSEMNARSDEIERQISDPAIAREHTKLVSLSKERSKLQPIVQKYRVYTKVLAGMEDAQQILDDKTADPDFRALAEEELEQLTAEKDALLEEIQNTLIMADDIHIGSVIMEIRAGTGGEEAALFARDLYEMYGRYAATRRWRVEQLDFSPSDMGGFREVILAQAAPVSAPTATPTAGQ